MVFGSLTARYCTCTGPNFGNGCDINGCFSFPTHDSSSFNNSETISHEYFNIPLASEPTKSEVEGKRQKGGIHDEKFRKIRLILAQTTSVEGLQVLEST